MRITTTVQLESGDAFAYTADAAAAQVLAALGGDVTNDTATVQVIANETGGVGPDYIPPNPPPGQGDEPVP